MIVCRKKLGVCYHKPQFDVLISCEYAATSETRLEESVHLCSSSSSYSPFFTHDIQHNHKLTRCTIMFEDKTCVHEESSQQDTFLDITQGFQSIKHNAQYSPRKLSTIEYCLHLVNSMLMLVGVLLLQGWRQNRPGQQVKRHGINKGPLYYNAPGSL